ncbi:hypothetical protein BLNAU_22033 [Blattamonas nauphoetae]|uniref:Uncharacterized protein n=1 Tax=Blattamonas nauphoetae TaxID=2049346 RepID=A0ABQ9WV97_9EUKA|nr:hypothetical protein BLNAU_22033 [Blattamonas nauphoetae]
MIIFLLGLILLSANSPPPTLSQTPHLTDTLRSFSRNADPFAVDITSEADENCSDNEGTDAKCPTINKAVSHYLGGKQNLALKIKDGTYSEENIMINELELAAVPLNWVEPEDTDPIDPTVSLEHKNKENVLFTVTTGVLKLTGIGIKRIEQSQFFIIMTSNGKIELDFCYFNGNGQWGAHGCIFLEASCSPSSEPFGTLTISSTFFHSFNRNLKAEAGSGGAIRALGGKYTISDSAFTSCKVNAYGGAISAQMNHGSSITNCTFIDCTAYTSFENRENAGALHLHSPGTDPLFSITNCLFKDNSANGQGNDIQIWGDLSKVVITNCYSTSNENRFLSEFDPKSGILNDPPLNPLPSGTTQVLIDGAVENCVTESSVTCSSISMAHSTFKDFPNTLSFKVKDSTSGIPETSIPVKDKSHTIQSGDWENDPQSFTPTVTLNCKAKVNFYSNSLFYITSGSLVMNGLKLVRTTGTGWFVCLDGSGSVELNYCEFDGNNVSSNNGAIVLSSNAGNSGIVKLNSVTMRKFVRIHGGIGGSCIRVDNGKVELSHSTFEENKASDSGGVLSGTIANGGSITNCLFLNNEAANGGGAIQLYGSSSNPFSITDTQFMNNVVTGEGKGKYGRDIVIYDDVANTLTITNCFTTSASPRLTHGENEINNETHKLQVNSLNSSVSIEHGKSLPDCYTNSTCSSLTQAHMFGLPDNTLLSLDAPSGPAFDETNIFVNARIVVIQPKDWVDPPVSGFEPTVTIDAQNTENSLVYVSTGSVTMNGLKMTRSSGTQWLFYVETGTVTLKYCTFDGSNIQRDFGWLSSISTSTVVVEHCTITQFNSTSDGGALFASSGTLTFTSSIFSKCSSTVTGGAVRSSKEALFTMTECKFVNNTGKNGGCFSGPKKGTQFISCHFTGNVGEIGGTIDVWGVPPDGFAIKDCRFENNTATSGANDIIVYNRDQEDTWKSKIVGCFTTSPMTSGSFSIGDGTNPIDIEVTQMRSCTFSVLGQIVIIDSTATDEGDCSTDQLKCKTITSAFSTLGTTEHRAVLLTASPTGGFNESKIDIISMTVTIEPFEWSIPSNPSGFEPSIVIKAITIIDNALIYVSSEGEMVMNGIRIGCEARGNSFIYMNGGSATLSYCIFDGNNAECYGYPFIHHKSLSTTEMKFCTVTQFVQTNADVKCGAILIDAGSGTLSATNCIFSNNKGVKGGAFNGPMDSAQFEDCQFISNTATEAGSAICVKGPNGGEFKILRCSFIDSQGIPNVGSDIHVDEDADGLYTKGIVGCVTNFYDNIEEKYFSTGNLANPLLNDPTRMQYKLSKAEVSEIVKTVTYFLKTSPPSGFSESSIPIADCTVTIKPTVWNDNPAWNFKPAIILTKTGSLTLLDIESGSLTMKGVEIKRTDKDGWMVSIQTGSADISFCSFEGAESVVEDGFLLIGDSGTATLFSCLVTKFNRGLNEGAAIRLNSGSLKATNCYFTENTAQLGGAISSPQSGLNLEYCWFLDNAASDGGSAIHAYGEYSENFKVHSCYFNNSQQVADKATYVSVVDQENDDWTNAFTACVVDKYSYDQDGSKYFTIGNWKTYLNDAKRARVGSIVEEATEISIDITYQSITDLLEAFQGGYYPLTITIPEDLDSKTWTETIIPVFEQRMLVKVENFQDPDTLDNFEPSVTLNAENSKDNSLIYVTIGSFEMSGVKIERTGGQGWLVYLDGSGSVELNYCVLDGNNAPRENGAIYITKEAGTSGVLKLDSVIMRKFVRDKVYEPESGSCIRANSGKVELANSYFEENSATPASGGAVSLSIVNGGSISHCRFMNNAASNGGGAVELFGTTTQTFEISNTLFMNNMVTGENRSKYGRDIVVYIGDPPNEETLIFTDCFTTSASPRLTAGETDFDTENKKLQPYTLNPSVSIEHGKSLSDCYTDSTCSSLTQAHMLDLAQTTTFSLVPELEGSTPFDETNINVNTRIVVIQPQGYSDPPDSDFVPTVTIDAQNTENSLVFVSTGSVTMNGLKMTRLSGTQWLFFVTEGTVTLSFCTFDGLNAQQSQGWLTSKSTSDLSSTVDVKHCTITQFNSSSHGGALSASSGTLTFTSTIFSDCSSDNYGGVIRSSDDALLKMTKCTFDNNKAAKGSCFSGPKKGAQFISCHFTGNVGQEGGAIDIWEESCDGFAIEDCRFQDNTATSGAKDIIVYDRDPEDTWKSKIVGCYTTSPMTSGSFSIGDGTNPIETDVTQMRSCTFSVLGQIVIIDSTATDEGDCSTDKLKCATITTAFSTLGKITGSRAVLLTASPAGGFEESDIPVMDMTVTIEPFEWSIPSNPSDFKPSVVIEAQTTGQASLIYVSGGSITMNGIRIGCTTRGNSFIYMDGGSSTLSYCVFDGNDASCDGHPFLYHNLSSTTVMEFCTVTQFVQTKTDVEGGAIRIKEGPGTFSATNCIFSNNKGVKGGAFNGPMKSAQFEDCQFISNTATKAGSAIFVWDAYVDTFKIHRCTFIDSQGLPNVGSDIHVYGDTVESYGKGIDGCVTNFLDNIPKEGDKYFSTGSDNDILDDDTKMQYKLSEAKVNEIVVDSSFTGCAISDSKLNCPTLSEAASINTPPQDTVTYFLKTSPPSGFQELSIPIADCDVMIKPEDWNDNPEWNFEPTIVLTKTGTSALLTIESGSLTMKGVEINRMEKEGWMVSIKTGSADISYCKFDGCNFEIEDGFLFIGDSGTATLFSCLVTKFNRGLNEGAAIRLNSGTLKATNCYFTENTAKFGGAISSPQSGLNLEYCWFLDNAASSKGSAVHAYGEYSENFKVHSCYFRGGSSTEAPTFVFIDDKTDAWKNAFTACVVDREGNSIGNGSVFLDETRRARVGSIVEEATEISIDDTHQSITDLLKAYQGGYYDLTITIPELSQPSSLTEERIHVFEQRMLVVVEGFQDPDTLDNFEPLVTLNAENSLHKSLIYVTIGSFEMSGVKILRTSGKGKGWLVYLDGSGSVELKYCVLDGSSESSDNGAICVTSNPESSGILKLDSVIMRKFIRTDGGMGGSCLRVDKGKVELSHSTFEENKTSDSGGVLSGTIANGGSITNCLFMNNEAVKGGGAIQLFGSSSEPFTITNCMFMNNLVTGSDRSGYGRDIVIYDDVEDSLTITNCFTTSASPRLTFKATDIDETNEKLKLKILESPVSIEHGKSLSDCYTESQCNSLTQAHLFMLNDDTTLSLDAPSGPAFVETSINVNSREVVIQPAGWSTPSDPPNFEPTLEIDAQNTKHSLVYVSTGSVTMNGLKMTRSSGTQWLFFVETGNITLKYCTFDGSNTQQSQGWLSSTSTSTVDVEHCSITQFNSTSDGGALSASSGTLTFTSTKFSDCSSELTGGAIFATSGTLSFTSTTFTGCSSTKDGGALSASAGTLSFSSTTFTGCSSQVSGGAALFGKSTNTRFDKVTFTDCSSQKNGGAVCMSGVSVSLFTSCVFEQCTSKETGGALELYKDGGLELSGRVAFVKCTFTSCSTKVEGEAVDGPQFGSVASLMSDSSSLASLFVFSGCKADDCESPCLYVQNVGLEENTKYDSLFPAQGNDFVRIWISEHNTDDSDECGKSMGCSSLQVGWSQRKGTEDIYLFGKSTEKFPAMSTAVAIIGDGIASTISNKDVTVGPLMTLLAHPVSIKDIHVLIEKDILEDGLFVSKNGGTLTMTSCDFRQSTEALSNPILILEVDSTTTLEQCSFKEIVSTASGSVIKATLTASIATERLAIKSCVFDSIKQTLQANSNTQGGSCLHATLSSHAQITITGTTFTGCTSTAYGAALFINVEGITPTNPPIPFVFTDISFESCKAGGETHGHHVYVRAKDLSEFVTFDAFKYPFSIYEPDLYGISTVTSPDQDQSLVSVLLKTEVSLYVHATDGNDDNEACPENNPCQSLGLFSKQGYVFNIILLSDHLLNAQLAINKFVRYIVPDNSENKKLSLTATGVNKDGLISVQNIVTFNNIDFDLKLGTFPTCTFLVVSGSSLTITNSAISSSSNEGSNFESLVHSAGTIVLKQVTITGIVSQNSHLLSIVPTSSVVLTQVDVSGGIVSSIINVELTPETAHHRTILDRCKMTESTLGGSALVISKPSCFSLINTEFSDMDQHNRVAFSLTCLKGTYSEINTCTFDALTSDNGAAYIEMQEQASLLITGTTFKDCQGGVGAGLYLSVQHENLFTITESCKFEDNIDKHNSNAPSNLFVNTAVSTYACTLASIQCDVSEDGFTTFGDNSTDSTIPIQSILDAKNMFVTSNGATSTNCHNSSAPCSSLSSTSMNIVKPTIFVLTTVDASKHASFSSRATIQSKETGVINAKTTPSITFSANGGILRNLVITGEVTTGSFLVSNGDTELDNIKLEAASFTTLVQHRSGSLTINSFTSTQTSLSNPLFDITLSASSTFALTGSTISGLTATHSKQGGIIHVQATGDSIINIDRMSLEGCTLNSANQVAVFLSVGSETLTKIPNAAYITNNKRDSTSADFLLFATPSLISYLRSDKCDIAKPQEGVDWNGFFGQDSTLSTPVYLFSFVPEEENLSTLEIGGADAEDSTTCGKENEKPCQSIWYALIRTSQSTVTLNVADLTQSTSTVFDKTEVNLKSSKTGKSPATLTITSTSQSSVFSTQKRLSFELFTFKLPTTQLFTSVIESTTANSQLTVKSSSFTSTGTLTCPLVTSKQGSVVLQSLTVTGMSYSSSKSGMFDLMSDKVGGMTMTNCSLNSLTLSSSSFAIVASSSTKSKTNYQAVLSKITINGASAAGTTSNEETCGWETGIFSIKGTSAELDEISLSNCQAGGFVLSSANVTVKSGSFTSNGKAIAPVELQKNFHLSESTLEIEDEVSFDGKTADDSTASFWIDADATSTVILPEDQYPLFVPSFTKATPTDNKGTFDVIFEGASPITACGDLSGYIIASETDSNLEDQVILFDITSTDNESYTGSFKVSLLADHKYSEWKAGIAYGPGTKFEEKFKTSAQQIKEQGVIPKPEGGNDNKGAVVGIVLGVVFGVLALIAILIIILVLVRRSNQKHRYSNDIDNGKELDSHDANSQHLDDIDDHASGGFAAEHASLADDLENSSVLPAKPAEEPYVDPFAAFNKEDPEPQAVHVMPFEGDSSQPAKPVSPTADVEEAFAMFNNVPQTTQPQQESEAANPLVSDTADPQPDLAIVDNLFQGFHTDSIASGSPVDELFLNLNSAQDTSVPPQEEDDDLEPPSMPAPLLNFGDDHDVM